MAEVLDRLKGALGSIARGGDPLGPYGNLYRAKVRALRGTKRVDVEVDDPNVPAMSNIPLKVGVPGVEVQLLPGHVVMVGWENRRPDRPFATTWSPGPDDDGTKPVKTTLHATALVLGGPLGAEPIIKGATYRAAEAAWLTANEAFTDAVGAAIAADGGIAAPLKAAVATALTALTTATAAFEASAYLSPVVTTQ